MALSNDLISQFVKLTNDTPSTKVNTTVNGTIVDDGDTKWVLLDGSGEKTPIETTIEVEAGDRVIVDIKDHTATVTGNLTHPAANTKTTEKIGTKVSEFEIIVAYRVTADDINATNGYFENLKSTVGSFDSITTEDLATINAAIESLEAKYANIDTLTANDVKALNAEIESLEATFANIQSISTDELDAAKANIHQLTAYNANFTYVHSEVLSSLKANINQLNLDKLDVKFANIDQAWFDEFYSKSGLIQDVTAEDISATGKLIGVLISGDMIEANTLKADRLLLKGKGGIYYQMNINAEGVEEVVTMYKVDYDVDSDTYTATDEIIEDVDGSIVSDVYVTIGEDKNIQTLPVYYSEESLVYFYKHKHYEVDGEEVSPSTEGIDGRAIVAESITTDKMKVTDLSAFGATIGGLRLENGKIHSYYKKNEGTIGKDTIDSTVKGIYIDKDGQFSVGDTENHLKFYIDTTYYRVSYDPDTGIYTATDAVIEDLEGVVVEDAYVSIVNGEITETYQVYFSEEKSEYFYSIEKYKLDIIADRILFGANSSDKLKTITEHIKIGKYIDPDTGEENPCVELSEDDSILSQIQTNKRTVFKDGDIEKTSIGQDGITTIGEVRHIVNTEEHKGQYTWATRANGNFGLMWKDVVN